MSMKHDSNPRPLHFIYHHFFSFPQTLNSVSKDLSFVWIAIKLAFKPFLSQTRDSIDKSNPIQNSDDVLDAATASPSKTDVGDADKDDYKFECNCYYFLLAFYISLNGQVK